MNKISNETLNYASNKEQTNKEVDEEHLEKEINLFSNTSTNGSEDKNWADILTFSRFLTIGNLFYEKLDARISIYFIILFSLVVFALILYSITKCNINKKLCFIFLINSTQNRKKLYSEF